MVLGIFSGYSGVSCICIFEGKMKSILGTSVQQIAPLWKNLQRDYLFDVILPPMIGGFDGILVSRYCQTVRFGDYSIKDLVRMKYGAYKRSYAGSLDIDNMEMVFLKPNPDVVSAYFYAWRRRIVDDRGYYYPKVNYARTVWFAFQERNGILTDLFRIEGVFPLDVPKYDVSYENAGIVRITISFNVDRVISVWSGRFGDLLRLR